MNNKKLLVSTICSAVSLRRSLWLTARQQAAARPYGPALRQKTSSLYYTVCPSSSIIKKIIQWKKQQEQTLPSLSLHGQLKTSAMFNFKKSSPENKDPNVSALEERVNALDQQNAAIMREMHNMTLHYFQQLERLERRITDFTDVWHPMMTSNIVRIKDELVAETKAHIVDIKQQIKNEIAEECVKPLSPIQQTDTLAGHVVVGVEHIYVKSSRKVNPVFANRCHIKRYGLSCVLRHVNAFIVDSIASFPQIKHFDLADFISFPGSPDSLAIPEMIDIDGNVLCSSLKSKPKYSQVEKLEQAFAKYGVELLYEGKSVRLLT